MRHLLCIGVLAGLALSAPLAHAQSAQGTQAGTYNALPPAPDTAPPGYQSEALNPGNCGTPDSPKPCPPMPKHPLKYYTPGPHPSDREG